MQYPPAALHFSISSSPNSIDSILLKETDSPYLFALELKFNRRYIVTNTIIKTRDDRFFISKYYLNLDTNLHCN